MNFVFKAIFEVSSKDNFETNEIYQLTFEKY